MNTVMEYPVLSPCQEMSAYEALWDRPSASFRSLSCEFQNAHRFPSSFVDPVVIEKYKKELLPVVERLPDFGVRIEGDGEYPSRLLDARHPVKVLYYQGDWDLVYLPSVSVVGTRTPSAQGIERTRALVRKLASDGFAIVSGLARGIDTAAHTAAIEAGGATIAVIGTPLNRCYPPENQGLQNEIASEFLLISQVPFARYAKQTFHENRLFFPQRNVTMSALSQATIIVEAGETSGTLVQARAALEQGRILFILENNFHNSSLTWPKKFEQKGAIRAKNYDDIRKRLLSGAS